MPKTRIVKRDINTSCKAKVRHASRVQAEAAYRGQQNYDGGRWHAYACPWCQGWHVSSGVKR